jgi:hypothetical protein
MDIQGVSIFTASNVT